MTHLLAILILCASYQVFAQFSLPTQVDMAWSVSDVSVQQVVQPPIQQAVNLRWECYDWEEGYYTGLCISTNLTDWICVAGFVARATNNVSVPRENMMFFRRWMCETNKF